MSDKAFEVRGPRFVAVEISSVTDEELLEIAKEQGVVSLDGFKASVSFFEARGSDFIVFQDGDYLTYSAEVFHRRFTPAGESILAEAEMPATEESHDSSIVSWKDRETRVTALQQAVAISQRGNVANTTSILKTAKEIEDYLNQGDVPAEAQA